MREQDHTTAIPADMAEAYAHIDGWGIDANTENDPTYPMRKRSKEAHKGLTWNRPALQPETVEILTSTERPSLPAVIGTTEPPKGLSGMLRRFAFRFSESDYLRWLPLMLADRVGVVEGLVSDVAKGQLPNIYKERGWSGSMKHDKTTFILKAAVTTAAAVALTVFLVREIKGRGRR